MKRRVRRAAPFLLAFLTMLLLSAAGPPGCDPAMAPIGSAASEPPSPFNPAP